MEYRPLVPTGSRFQFEAPLPGISGSRGFTIIGYTCFSEDVAHVDISANRAQCQVRLNIAEVPPDLSKRTRGTSLSSTLPELDKLDYASAIDASIMAFGLHKFSVYHEYHEE